MAGSAQMTTKCPYTLQWDAPFLLLKTVPCYGGIWTPSNTWFLVPTRVLNGNGIFIGSVASMADIHSATAEIR